MSKSTQEKFNIDAFPYVYICPRCGEMFTLSAEQDFFFRIDTDYFVSEPIFFQCKHCKHIPVKPVGYKGDLNLLIKLPYELPPENSTSFEVLY
jgi:hypothetical protein